jgi:L-2-hydroxyglutarate oxidase
MNSTAAGFIPTGSTTDVVIIGGGIVGLATALATKNRYPDLRVTVVEAEGGVSEHQSGHNSGVLHSGLYYKPGSQKALLCRAGKTAMEQFCSRHAIPWDRCGKVVVATSEDELPILANIAQRATANGVEFEQIDDRRLRQLEPAAAGIAALHVPETGIVNYRTVCQTMAKEFCQLGGQIYFKFRVVKIEQADTSLKLTSHHGVILNADRMVNCAGLLSDRVCRMADGQPQVQIVPFRGEYYELKPGRETLCKNLIYPVPDPSFPFLGVHFTRMIDGGVECGPNAVLALAREGYSWRQVRVGDFVETIRYQGFRKLATKYWRTGLGEMHRSLSKSAFVTALQKLIPSIRASDLKPGRAGVRAQAVSADGNLVDDFLIHKQARAVHVLNAPSPAATASLAIGEYITDQL